MIRLRRALPAISLCLLTCSCGSSTENGPQEPGVHAIRAPDGTILDDRSLCDWKEHKDREVSETAGPGAIQPNVRRVWQVFGTGSDKRKVLMCREIDTNLDGVKDVVRTYNDEGQAKEERADSNYDGKLDTWIIFSKGRLAEVRMDHNHDGEPDEWKNFVDGKLIRVKRDTNFDTKADTWEMYQKGRLVRMGVDVDHDARIDRWDHDAEWRSKREAAERKAEEAAEKKKGGGETDEKPADEGGEGGDDDSVDADKASGKTG